MLTLRRMYDNVSTDTNSNKNLDKYTDVLIKIGETYQLYLTLINHDWNTKVVKLRSSIMLKLLKEICNVFFL